MDLAKYRIGAGLLAGVVAVLGALAQPVRANDSLVEFTDDALTVRVDGVPAANVLQEIARSTGAEIRGALTQSRDVTASFDAVPVQEALQRLLPDQAFSLHYKGKRLAAIELVDRSGKTQQAKLASPVLKLKDETDEHAALRAAAGVALTARQHGMAAPGVPVEGFPPPGNAPPNP